MSMRTDQAVPSLRTLLILGRVSNLPTVWSNCLAGWLISGGGDVGNFLLLCSGATFLYIGGMFLNDAFDVDFDRQHRPERPIPSGAITLQAVWRWGLWWLLAGLLCLGFLGKIPTALGMLLALFIIIYDAVHKMFVFAPIIMAICRFLLVLIASAAAYDEIIGLSIWSAFVLALYIVGLSYLARKESAPGALQYWPCVLLAGPVVLALVVNQGPYQGRGLLVTALYVFWTVRSLWFTYWSPQKNIGRSVAGLLAGIVLVDLLATGGLWSTPDLTFGILFLLALLFQRFVPAT